MALKGRVELEDIDLKKFKELVAALKDPACEITELDISMLTLNGEALNAEQAIELGQALMKNTSIHSPKIGILLEPRLERPPVPLSFEEALKQMEDRKEMKEGAEQIKNPRIRAALVQQFKGVTTIHDLGRKEFYFKDLQQVLPTITADRANGELAAIQGMIDLENEKVEIAENLKFLKEGGTILARLMIKYRDAGGASDALKNLFKKIDEKLNQIDNPEVQSEIKEMVNKISWSIALKHPEHQNKKQIEEDIRSALNNYIDFKHITGKDPNFADTLRDRLEKVEGLLAKNSPKNIQEKYLAKYNAFGITFDPNDGYQKMLAILEENRAHILAMPSQMTRQITLAQQWVAPFKDAMIKKQELAVTELREVQRAYYQSHAAQLTEAQQSPLAKTDEKAAPVIELRKAWKENFSEWKGELEKFSKPSSPAESSTPSTASTPSPKSAEQNKMLSFGMMRAGSGSQLAMHEAEKALKEIIEVLEKEEKVIQALIVDRGGHEGWGVEAEEQFTVKDVEALRQSYQRVVDAFMYLQGKIQNPILQEQVFRAKSAFEEELGWVKEKMEAKAEKPQRLG